MLVPSEFLGSEVCGEVESGLAIKSRKRRMGGKNGFGLLTRRGLPRRCRLNRGRREEEAELGPSIYTRRCEKVNEMMKFAWSGQ